MPRLLIVSPHFPPVNAPDEHRVRMSLPQFARSGWDVTVLTVDDPTPLAPLDPELSATVPAAVRVVRAPAWSRRWTGRLGVHNLGWRALVPLHRAACRLLRAERFDVVYFSTTQFITLPLGRLWRRRFGIPYVIDLQDPWVTDYYERPGAPRPPGGWKYRIARGIARLLEGWSFRRVAHVFSVSARYIDELAARHAWFDRQRASVLTFGASGDDLAAARRSQSDAPPLLPASNARKVVYVGALGPGFIPALDTLFAAARLADDGARPLEFHFLGTSYAGAGRAASTTAAAAERHGVARRVYERTERLGFIAALRVLLEADAVLLLGTDDPGYSPSKIHPVLLAGRPTLAVGPAGCVLEQKITELGGAAFFATGADDAVRELSDALRDLAASGTVPARPLDRARLESAYGADPVAVRQLAVFEAILREAR